MLNEKDQRKIFNKCFNQLKSTLSSQPYAITSLFESLKRKRDKIVTKVTLPESEHHKQITEYENDIMLALREELNSMIHDGPIKDATEYTEVLRGEIEKVSKLSDEVSTGKIDIENIKIDNEMKEWRGADVIITSNYSEEISSKYIVVRTVNAKQVTWLMIQLRELCTNYINYLNKYEFYGTIAENAIAFIEKHGDKDSNSKVMIIHLLNQVIVLLWSKISKTDDFINKKRNTFG
jgi:hypothetical protein